MGSSVITVALDGHSACLVLRLSCQSTQHREFPRSILSAGDPIPAVANAHDFSFEVRLRAPFLLFPSAHEAGTWNLPRGSIIWRRRSAGRQSWFGSSECTIHICHGRGLAATLNLF